MRILPTRPLLLASFLLLAPAPPARAENPYARFATTLGAFDVELCETVSARCLGAAPGTVARFLADIDAGKYAPGSIIDRSANPPNLPEPFVLQGGAWRLDGLDLQQVPPGATIPNEFNQPNARGTISVPLNGTSVCDTDPNSGATGWFINVGSNEELDCGSFTVFGVVIGNGMQVVDDIAGLRIYQVPLFGNEVPLLDTFPCAPPNPFANDPQCLASLPQPAQEYLVQYGVTRIPEPAAALAGAAPLAALAALHRRRRAPRR